MASWQRLGQCQLGPRPEPLALGDGSREDPGGPSGAWRRQEGILILTSSAN